MYATFCSSLRSSPPLIAGRLGREQIKGVIHCTDITKLLLERVHFREEEEEEDEEEEGDQWSQGGDKKDKKDSKDGKGSKDSTPTFPKLHSHPYNTPFTINTVRGGTLTCTFISANHCPGAAIILYTPSPTPNVVNVHCGDMRYQPSMLEECLKKRKEGQRFGEVFLDTTYGLPKYTFPPQATVITSVSSRVSSELQREGVRTLVLLSCYSIGKEKLLKDVAIRLGRELYVTERKARMLKCVMDGSSTPPDDQNASPNDLVRYTTRNPKGSPIHVIPMNVAGEMFPFFIPDYRACADYADTKTGGVKYDRVVAFIPTGWANASNWNRKNGRNEKVVPRRMKDGGIGVMKVAEDEGDTVVVEVRGGGRGEGWGRYG